MDAGVNERSLTAALERASERDLRRLRNLGVGDVTRFMYGYRLPVPWLARAIADELDRGERG